MSFGLFSVTAVLGGIVALAIGLWLAQRLRVQHREVEVLTTLFWQSAMEETRARVFVRRFRHWWAWVLLVVIASLLWMLLSQPRTISWDETRHIVLIDWSVDDPQVRQQDLDVALKLAAQLPDTDREIIAVGTRLETLLRPLEPLELARQRSKLKPGLAPQGLDWAIESLAARAGPKTPITIHIVGDASIDQEKLLALRSDDRDTSQSPPLNVFRINQEHVASPPINLATLGVSDSASGDWNLLDIWIAFDDSESVQASHLGVLLDKQPLKRPFVKREDGILEIQGIEADAGLIEVMYDGRLVGVITLPNRDLIRVHMDNDVPETLRQLVQLDPACEIVDDPKDSEVFIGSATNANFRLTSGDQPSFLIQTENKNPQAALANLVDALALRQIDATGIAVKSGRVVDVQAVSGSSRSLALWRSLFTSSFDFQESRACPIVVGRSIRWLANRPPLVEWAELGRRLPVASPEYDRASADLALTNDGRQLRTTRLTPLTGQVATLDNSNESLTFSGINLVPWMGLLVAFMLIGEWILFQRGYMP